MGPNTQHIVAIPTTSLVEGSTSVPIFLPFKAPTPPPSFSQSAIWTKEKRMATVCTQQKHVQLSLQLLCVSLSVCALIPFLIRICKFELSKLTLHATCYHWFFYVHTCQGSIHMPAYIYQQCACMHASPGKQNKGVIFHIQEKFKDFNANLNEFSNEDFQII